MMSADKDNLHKEKQTEQVLLSSMDPVSKVKHLIGLGHDETEANDIVERYQMGQMVPVYFERLEFDESDFEE